MQVSAEHRDFLHYGVQTPVSKRRERMEVESLNLTISTSLCLTQLLNSDIEPNHVHRYLSPSGHLSPRRLSFFNLILSFS
jgi:hypothetical protein